MQADIPLFIEKRPKLFAVESIVKCSTIFDNRRSFQEG